MAANDERPTLLALSAVHRNALVTALTRCGWPVIGVRGFDEVVRRLGETGARGAIVDLRDEPKAGLAAIRALSSRTRVLAIVPGRDIRWITEAIDAGATHYLTSPFPQVELAQAVRLIVRAGPIAVRAEEAKLLEGAAATEAIGVRLANGRVSALLVAATRFEAVNAAFGRDVGDELVGIVGQRIAGAVRDIDGALLARMGGAEFAVLVPAGSGMAVATDICRRIDRPFMVPMPLSRLAAGSARSTALRAKRQAICCAEQAAHLPRRAPPIPRRSRRSASAKPSSRCWVPRSRPICAARSRPTRSRSCFSHSYRSRRGKSSASRRLRAGSIPNTARWGPIRCSPSRVVRTISPRCRRISRHAHCRSQRRGARRSTACDWRST